MIAQLISQTLNIPTRSVENALKLFSEGATIPFISRYRKEATGGLDEVHIGEIKQLHTQLVELEKRKEFILQSIASQEKLTTELEKRIKESWESAELEDIYLPYKPKRQTRAEAARKRGL